MQDLNDGNLTWKFVQSFGDDNSSDDDLVTAVEFDETGDFLAVGDKAGRICIFEANSSDECKDGNPIDYKFYTEFQSHEPEFDCLRSLEIEEKINVVKWTKRQSSGLFLLATNDKTIKFWKVHEKKIKRPNRTLQVQPRGENDVIIPKLAHYETITTASLKRVFGNAHGYHINSLSVNSDGETFISADDLRINLWNLEISDESFNIVDLKPPNLEELTEVITSASCHPTHCSQLLYSSSRGSIRLGDLRDSALLDVHAKVFEQEDDPANKSFFSEIISSISDAQFTPDGRYIVSRDYLTLKVWDVHMESQPVEVIPIHEYLKLHLSDLYDNDCIFDKFECAASPDGRAFATGSYNNNFMLHNLVDKTSITIEALKDPPQRASRTPTKLPPAPASAPATTITDAPDVSLMDFGKKALHVAWHPRANTIAVAGLNKLYIYQGSRSLA